MHTFHSLFELVALCTFYCFEYAMSSVYHTMVIRFLLHGSIGYTKSGLIFCYNKSIGSYFVSRDMYPNQVLINFWIHIILYFQAFFSNYKNKQTFINLLRNFLDKQEGITTRAAQADRYLCWLSCGKAAV